MLRLACFTHSYYKHHTSGKSLTHFISCISGALASSRSFWSSSSSGRAVWSQEGTICERETADFIVSWESSVDCNELYDEGDGMLEEKWKEEEAEVRMESSL